MTALVSLCFALAVPAEALKPNTLTPVEAAEGWLLLFDGETAFGQHVDGEVHPVEGELIIGGSKETRLNFPFPQFELKAEVRTLEGAKPAMLVLAHDDAGALAEARTAFASFPPSKEWNRASVTVRRDTDLGPTDTRNTINNHIESGQPGTSKATLTYGRAAFKSSLEIPVGTRMAFRSLKIKPTGLAPLFNGKDLSGWKEHPGKKSIFSVTSDGLLSIKNGPGDLQTDGQYGDFVLQIECKTNGKGLNSGVFFRCRPGEYQQGYEAQIHNDFSANPPKEYVVEEYDSKTSMLLRKTQVASTAKDYGTGAIYRRLPARRGIARDNEWFTMTVLARGRHISTWVDGIQVIDWTDNRPLSDNARNGCRLEAGPLSLQGHDPTTDLVFRNINIADLSLPAKK